MIRQKKLNLYLENKKKLFENFEQIMTEDQRIIFLKKLHENEIIRTNYDNKFSI